MKSFLPRKENSSVEFLNRKTMSSAYQKYPVMIEASLENIKMEFNIPPQIVEDSSDKRKINGKTSMLWNWIAFV